MTLKAIRAAGPCGIKKSDPETGWRLLLQSLGEGFLHYNADRIVSLGDIAKSNDAADAMWCVRALDWSDIAVRRAVIAGAVLPAVKRASVHTKDKRVFEAITIIERWCAGDDKADLNKARKLAYAADAADAAYAAAYAYASYAAYAVAAAYDVAASYAAYAREADREQQRIDIIAAFPPVALAVKVMA
jgi:hypothetical protein